MAMKTAGALLLSILVLALAACSSDSGDAVAVNPNIYPTDYKSEIIATLRPMFFEHQTATISDAEISPPALTAIDKDQRYSLCVRYTEHAAGTGNINTGIRRGYFYAGHLNQLVAATDDECKGMAYQPFTELNRLCLGNACVKKPKSKSGWSLF